MTESGQAGVLEIQQKSVHYVLTVDPDALTIPGSFAEGYSSGQRGQTVNLLAMPT